MGIHTCIFTLMLQSNIVQQKVTVFNRQVLPLAHLRARRFLQCGARFGESHGAQEHTIPGNQTPSASRQASDVGASFGSGDGRGGRVG